METDMKKIDTSKLKLKVKCDFAHCKASFDNIEDFEEHWRTKHGKWGYVSKATISERKGGKSL
jgi:hypothetical protein